MSAATHGVVDLVSQSAARDYQAELTACYLNHSANLVGYLVPLVGDVGIAQDLAQEAFVELFARWRSVQHPRAYVYMTATNLARTHWRRRERERTALAHVEQATADVAEAHDPWLWDLVQRLDARLRVPVLLHYYADLPVKDVADQLNLPVGTVKRRLHEARALLLDVVEESRA
jgi:RNA polymerase sigma-70 factor (ECF subfamily)